MPCIREYCLSPPLGKTNLSAKCMRIHVIERKIYIWRKKHTQNLQCEFKSSAVTERQNVWCACIGVCVSHGDCMCRSRLCADVNEFETQYTRMRQLYRIAISYPVELTSFLLYLARLAFYRHFHFIISFRSVACHAFFSFYTGGNTQFGIGPHRCHCILRFTIWQLPIFQMHSSC